MGSCAEVREKIQHEALRWGVLLGTARRVIKKVWFSDMYFGIKCSHWIRFWQCQYSLLIPLTTDNFLLCVLKTHLRTDDSSPHHNDLLHFLNHTCAWRRWHEFTALLSNALFYLLKYLRQHVLCQWPALLHFSLRDLTWIWEQELCCCLFIQDLGNFKGVCVVPVGFVHLGYVRSLQLQYSKPVCIWKSLLINPP